MKDNMNLEQLLEQAKNKLEKMGLDMNLKKIPRTDYESISREDFWYEEFDKSKELIYWRKKYSIDEWFHTNTSISDECSDEITKEKLEELIKWLKKEELKEDAEKIKNVIKQTDFDKEVIFYSYCN
jgi:hypothetical protein